MAESFETFAVATERTEAVKRKLELGMKRKRDHIGNIGTYVWSENECYEEVCNYQAGQCINYSELARRYNLLNAKEETPKNGGQIVKKYLEERGCDLTLFNSVYNQPIDYDTKKIREVERKDHLVNKWFHKCFRN